MSTSARNQRPAARILLLDPDGRILLFRFDAGDRPAFWATPGGALDPDEDYPACARRELREETGLDLDCGVEVARRVVEFVTLEDVPVLAENAISSPAPREPRLRPPAIPSSNDG